MNGTDLYSTTEVISVATTDHSMQPISLLSLNLDKGWSLSLQVNAGVVLAVGLGLVVWWKRDLLGGNKRDRYFEIDEATIGVGSQTLTFKPNERDRQIAYSIWVELSTRKIGLEIDPERDVIAEVYDSWHHFFTVTRELIKDIPVSKLKSKSTDNIVNLSIDVLNKGLRPHLTEHQARFRRWYEHELNRQGNADIAPQVLQAKYPHFDDLMKDLLKVNKSLMIYREKMGQLMRI